ncbi:MAG: glycosyltransferase family 4 protein [Prevotella sp.]|nr:glycosyltransferase family 4 protein [Prevotella sp.]
MKVLIVNTSERTGGAAVAANRLMEALNRNGAQAKMLVRDKQTDSLKVVALKRSPWLRWNFLWERLCLFFHLHFNRKNLFAVDIANAGSDITRLREFREADIIHLHWINQGMLSLKNIRKILQSGKPVVWTMHDFWPCTGICHYPRMCSGYLRRCGRCPYMPGGGSGSDLSNAVWNKKSKIYNTGNIIFVACSKWLADKARQSSLLRGRQVECIPNAIDTHIYRPTDKHAARERLKLPAEKRLILFVSQRITDERKGIRFFIDAIAKIAEDHPEMQETAGVVILGGHAEEFADKLALPVYPIGFVSDEKTILDVYNSVDLFVLPSLEDNLPNTIMESMACGVPCVGFRSGGIPEMIDHRKNGYVAKYRDADDLSRGIYWTLCEADQEQLSREAVRKVVMNYSQSSVALQYTEVYNHALAFKRFGI